MDELERLRNSLRASREECRRWRSEAQSLRANGAGKAEQPAQWLPALDAIARLRADLRAETATIRQELDDLAALVHSLIREP